MRSGALLAVGARHRGVIDLANKRRESFDVFAVPRNFGEDGMTFNGISRRNLVEGGIFAFLSGYPIAMHLPVALSVRIVLLCFISLPLFFFGMIGIGGESVTQFVATWCRWLFHRRILRYYIDTGEMETERPKGWARIKAFFSRERNDDISYVKVKKRKRRGGPGWFDRVFASRKVESAQPEDAPKSRRIKHQAQTFFPVADIRGGMLVSKDKRYVKVVEIRPINFLLRSADEQRDIILSFAELLRIAPVKIQFKSNANKADISKFLSNTVSELQQETSEQCREMGENYIQHIQSTATQNAISRRFFVIFEYENPLPTYAPTEAEIRFALESAVRNFRSYLSRCGNQSVEFENEKEENEFLLHLLFILLDNYNTDEMTLDSKIDRAFRMRLAGDNMEEMCIADYASPDRIDFTRGKYAVIDGVYHAYLYIPSAGFKTLVGAAWLSPLINAGEAIDVDLFLHKQPADRMQQQVSRNLRLNKAKLHEISSTSADYNRMGDIMESGYFLQKGLNDGQDFVRHEVA